MGLFGREWSVKLERWSVASAEAAGGIFLLHISLLAHFPLHISLPTLVCSIVLQI